MYREKYTPCTYKPIQGLCTIYVAHSENAPSSLCSECILPGVEKLLHGVGTVSSHSSALMSHAGSGLSWKN